MRSDFRTHTISLSLFLGLGVGCAAEEEWTVIQDGPDHSHPYDG